MGEPLKSSDFAHDSVSVRLEPVGINQYPPVITALAIDPLGEWIAASGDDHVIRLLSRSTMKVEATLIKHVDWVRSLEFSPDGKRLVSAGNDGQLIVWHRDSDWSAEQGLVDAPALRCATFSPDGKMIAAVGFAPKVFLMSVDSDARPKLDCACRDLRSVDYRSDSLMLAVAGRSGDVHFYEATTGSTLGDVQLHRKRISNVGFIGDTNRLFTTGEDGHAVVYDTELRRVLQDFEVANCKLFAGCMLGESHLAVGGSDNLIRIFNIDNGTLVAKLLGHSGTIATLVSANGELYSGSFDTTLRRWDLRGIVSGARVAEIDVATQPDARTSRLPRN